jgi:hypothetical protein
MKSDIIFINKKVKFGLKADEPVARRISASGRKVSGMTWDRLRNISGTAQE